MCNASNKRITPNNTKWVFSLFSILSAVLCFESPSQTGSTCRCEMLRQLMNMHRLALTLQSSFLTFIRPFGSVWKASPNTPSTHNPCFRHVLVIIKHNNGFYKSPFASLVTWIIQLKRERTGGRGARLQQSGGPCTWDGRRQMRHFVWIIYLILFNFLQLPHCFFFPLLFFPTHPFLLLCFSPQPPSHTHSHTHTHTLCKPSRLFQAAVITVAQAVKLSSDD